MKIDKPYPYNLLDDIFGGDAPDCLIYGELPPDNEHGPDYVLSLLTERERGVLNCYYDEGITPGGNGQAYGVTRETHTSDIGEGPEKNAASVTVEIHIARI